MRTYLVILLTALVSACDGTKSVDSGANCPDIARPALSVTPIDGATGEVLRALGTASAIDGSFVDTQKNAPPLDPTFYLAYLRAGNYTVTVDISGYATWKLENVLVPKGVCGVLTVPLAARLHKSQASVSAP
jgi:hypothetical protein